jgi:hypothetical protein
VVIFVLRIALFFALSLHREELDELERVGTVCLGVRVLQILLYLCVCVYVCDMWLLCVLGAETRRYLSTCSVCAGAWSARIRLLRA